MQNSWALKCKNGTNKLYIYVFSSYDLLMWNMYNLHFN